MNACVLTIGNEILAGDIHDNNFREICAIERQFCVGYCDIDFEFLQPGCKNDRSGCGDLDKISRTKPV